VYLTYGDIDMKRDPVKDQVALGNKFVETFARASMDGAKESKSDGPVRVLAVDDTQLGAP
jgi:hypothetical protein